MGDVKEGLTPRQQTAHELDQKKHTLKQRLSSIEKLDLLIHVITYKIFETQHDFRHDIDDLLGQREQLIKRTDCSANDMGMAVAELDKKIADRKNMHESAMTSLEGQRTELRKENALKVHHMDAILESLKAQNRLLLSDLEAQKLNASPSQLEELQRRIFETNRLFDKDVEDLKRLQESGWKDYDAQEMLSEKLEARGLRVTKSGNFLTASGRHLTRSEASCLGLFDGIEVPSWHTMLDGPYMKAGSESSLTQISSTASLESRMTSEDVYYLKMALGKPLTLALAEITAKQPRDPIHYLGHWLFKYRYNQELDVMKKQEIQELMDERDRLEKDKLHKMLEEEAQAVMLDLVIRTEEEAIRRELERIAREAAMLEGEEGNSYNDNYDEVKDALGY